MGYERRFKYWAEEEKQKHLLSLFLAIDIAVAYAINTSIVKTFNTSFISANLNTAATFNFDIEIKNNIFNDIKAIKEKGKTGFARKLLDIVTELFASLF